MNKYYLLIKEIEQTGLKYLCKRKYCAARPGDHISYKGSGVLWRRVLKKHPYYTIKTTVLGLFDTAELKHRGLYYSNLYNVVESKDWANLKPECGDGGDTSKTPGYVQSMENRKQKPLKDYKTAHNPQTGVVRRVPPNGDLPEGFVWGNLKGKGYGPKKDQTEVYHNGQEKIYVEKGSTPPDGFVRGVWYEGSTKNRIGCHNPTTMQKKYVICEDDIPEGWVKGLFATTGNKIQTPNGIFSNVQECMRTLKLTRHQIMKMIDSQPENWFFIKEI